MEKKMPEKRKGDNKPEDEMISSLSREQKKMWMGMSRHEKKRILRRMDDRVKRRMRFRFEAEGERGLFGFKEEEKRKDRYQKAKEEVQNRAEKKRERKIKPQEAPAYRKRKEKTQRSVFDAELLDPQKEKAEDFKRKINQKAPQNKGQRESIHDQKDAGYEAGNSKEEPFTGPGFYAGEKEKRETPQRKRAPEDPPGNGGFVRQKRRKRKEKGNAEAYKKTEKKLVLKEFASLISRDEKRRESKNEEIHFEQVNLTQVQQETGKDALRILSFPVRIKAGKLKEEAAVKITEVLTGSLKYFLGFGGIILALLFLFLLFAALIGTIAGQEQENAPHYSASGEEIVAYAKEWIGITKYIYGAGRASPTDWQDYADCSSFVHGVFNHFGIELGSDTYAMEGNGTVIEGGINAALPGDLILFYSGCIAPGNSSHVGIYAGDGMMVHCSGGKANVSPATAGRGVCMGSVAGDGRSYEVRRIVTDVLSGYSRDPTGYTLDQMEVIWAVVCQEDGGSYAGALAVISTAMNRVDSPGWSSLGNNAYLQLTAPGQFCYSIDTYWKKYLNGNVPDFVKQAVSDCLDRGIRNHTHTCFRSYYTEGSEQIGGGNYYFG